MGYLEKALIFILLGGFHVAGWADVSLVQCNLPGRISALSLCVTCMQYLLYCPYVFVHVFLCCACQDQWWLIEVDKLHYICEQRKNSFIEESVNFRRQGRAGNMSSERGENVVRNLAYVLEWNENSESETETSERVRVRWKWHRLKHSNRPM